MIALPLQMTSNDDARFIFMNAIGSLRVRYLAKPGMNSGSMTHRGPQISEPHHEFPDVPYREAPANHPRPHRSVAQSMIGAIAINPM